MLSCTKKAETPKPAPSRPSDVNVEVRNGGPIVVTTRTAEFQILPSGFIQATLLKDGKRLTLDEPGPTSTGGSDSIVHEGKELDFIPDFSQAKVTEAIGKLGRGKRLELPARPLAASGIPIERTLVLEAYDDFPNIALVTASYKNAGSADFQIEKVLMQEHLFSAKPADANAQPFDMWSFQGSSYDWGKDDVFKLTKRSLAAERHGRERSKAATVVGFRWSHSGTRPVGEAIGHVETVPLTLSIPVKVESDGLVDAHVEIDSRQHALKPGDTYSTPRSFVSVYAATFTSRCRSGRACCRKKAGRFPSPPTKPTT